MRGTDVVSRVDAFNSDREPERLAVKYAAMRTSPFAFFRGTCHLFYEDLDTGALPPSPLVWCCGDLHLQNFGTYKGDNRLVYFDINDFDEACLAPASWEVVRLLSSIVVAGEDLGIPARTQSAWMRALTGGFAAALSSGKARWIERATASGQIRELLLELKARKRRKFLDRRAPVMQKNGRRRLLIDGKRTLALLPGQRKMLDAAIAKFAAAEAEPGFFRILDAARRVAGTGSLGLERYVLLVEGRGSPDGNFLLDFKHEPGSCLAMVCAELPPQPKWKSEAERVAVTQHDVQANAPALLRPVLWKGRSFLLHELAPTSDRLEIERWRDAPDDGQVEASLRAMGQIVGWGFLRSSARRGAALPVELMEFGRNARPWEGALIECARECARRNKQQYEAFARTRVTPSSR
jgi:uncharacterized protein (DUF2252 family)